MARTDALRTKRGVSADTLKFAAAFTMLLDHMDVVFWGRQMPVLCMIGRLAFPIYAFFLVEGFLHTRSVKRYAGRLLLLALLSEVPYRLAVFGQVSLTAAAGGGPGLYNTCFTLFTGLLMLNTLSFLERKLSQGESGKKGFYAAVMIAAIALFCGAAALCKMDYHVFGIGLIAIFYGLRYDRKRACVAGALLFSFEPSAAVAFVLLYFYNGRRLKSKALQIGFYVFYPLHLLVLYGISLAAF